MTYPRIGSFKSALDFQTHLDQSHIELSFDPVVETGPNAPLAQPYRMPNGFVLGNRFCVLPMEGWDGTEDGRPSEFTFRRWRHFGLSGAKLIWGGEATAVRPDGRANPNQLVISARTMGDLAALREGLIAEHPDKTDDLLIGLQLTHSGRFARPRNKKPLEPMILYHHPLYDRKFGLSADYPVMTDDDILRLVEDYGAAARLAQRAGFAFVDVKHCHGYLGHEFLSAVDRPGRFGGSFENRTRFLREVVSCIRAKAPGLAMGVRLSVFDFAPFRAGADGVGKVEPFEGKRYRYAFGGDGTGVGIDLTEPCAFLDVMVSLDIRLFCASAGNPYVNPHVTRPAFFPPSDGYLPPEDPLAGVARQIGAASELKRHCPEMLIVGSGYSYLQEWLPNVAQHVVRTGKADFVGLGRAILSYPEMCRDVLAGRPLQRKRICRTFSDCTTAPRNGLPSGCYPLDDYYKKRPEAEELKAVKRKRS